MDTPKQSDLEGHARELLTNWAIVITTHVLC